MMIMAKLDQISLHKKSSTTEAEPMIHCLGSTQARPGTDKRDKKRFMKLAKWTTLTRGAGCHHGIALCLTESGRHQRMKRTMKLVEAHAARFDKI